MADKASFPDDISELWSGHEDTVLEPLRPNVPAKNGHRIVPTTTNGSHAEAPDPATIQALDSITRMLGSIQADVARVHKAIDALRDEVSVLRERTDRVRGFRPVSFPRLGHAPKLKDDPFQ